MLEEEVGISEFSPFLFNIFAEEAITVMKEKLTRIKIDEGGIHSLRFTNNSDIFPESDKRMTKMVNILEETLGKCKMDIKESDTEILSEEAD